jgi:hypothetical protein
LESDHPRLYAALQVAVFAVIVGLTALLAV